jgi:hypothetical protein
MSYYSDPNPYQSPYQPAPSFPPPGPGFPPPTPGVWYGYIAYCLFMALLYLAVVALGVLFLVVGSSLPLNEPDDPSPTEMIIMGSVFCVMGGVLMLMYGIAPLLPKRKGAWIYGFVTIGIGMTSACTLPFCIPLLIFWLRPETKAFFHVK